MYCLCSESRRLFLNHNDDERHLQYYCNNIIAVHTYCLTHATIVLDRFFPKETFRRSFIALVIDDIVDGSDCWVSVWFSVVVSECKYNILWLYIFFKRTLPGKIMRVKTWFTSFNTVQTTIILHSSNLYWQIEENIICAQAFRFFW